MVLVDTSVLIDYLKGTDTDGTRCFDKIIDDKMPYGINDYVYQEILQGARTEAEFEKLKDYFETIPFYYLQFGKESFERAALLNYKCRKRGITIRSKIDLLIAEIAIENDLYLLHSDSDYDNIAKASKVLKIYTKA